MFINNVIIGRLLKLKIRDEYFNIKVKWFIWCM